MTVYTQSIWQKMRNLFVRGYEKVTSQELQLANALRGKLAGIGYVLTRIFFAIIKLAIVMFLLCCALGLFVLIVVWLAIRFFISKQRVNRHNQEQRTAAGNDSPRQERRPRLYDNNGNLIK